MAKCCVESVGRGIFFKGKAILNANSFICAAGGEIIIEDNVSINRNTIIVSRERVSIGAGTSVGPNVCIYDHNHKFDKNGFYKDDFRTNAVKIGKNVWIAANCIILKGATIGDNCIIGAGCVIKGEILANTIVSTNNNLQREKLR